MRSFYLVIALLIPGCGAVDGPATQKSSGDQETPTPDDSATQGAAAAAQHALLVADASGLPACDQGSEGLLVYVRADAAFQVCVNAAWSVVDLRGKDGANGKDGASGKDGVDSSSTVWLDVQSGRRWVAAVTANWASAQSACSSSYALPPCDDLLEAANHGLYNGLSQHTEAWCDEEVGTLSARYVTTNSNPTIGVRTKTDTIGTYCVESAD